LPLTSRGLLVWTLETDSCARCRRQIFTSTITIGRRTTGHLWQRRRQVPATTIGGSRRFAKSRSRQATPHPSTSLLFKSQFLPGHPTASGSPSLNALLPNEDLTQV